MNNHGDITSSCHYDIWYAEGRWSGMEYIFHDYIVSLSITASINSMVSIGIHFTRYLSIAEN